MKSTFNKLSKEFNGSSKEEHAWRVIGPLLENIKFVEDRFSNRVSGIALLCITSELISLAALAKVEVFGFEVKDISIVEKVIPAVICYLYFTCISFVITRRILEDSVDEILDATYPNLKATEFKLLLRPQQPFKIYSILLYHATGVFRNMLSFSGNLLALAILVFSPLYSLYAFVRVGLKHGFEDLITCAFGAVALVFALQALLLLLSINSIYEKSESE